MERRRWFVVAAIVLGNVGVGVLVAILAGGGPEVPPNDPWSAPPTPSPIATPAEPAPTPTVADDGPVGDAGHRVAFGGAAPPATRR